MSDETPEQWSMRRWKQLEKLERLLIDCESLDAGNCILSRIKRLIHGSENLRKWNRDRREQSFVNFLREQARVGYSRRKKKPPKAKVKP